MGYLEYLGVEIKNLGDFQVTLLRDSPNGKVIFSTDTQYDRGLNSGDKLPLGSYRGGFLNEKMNRIYNEKTPEITHDTLFGIEREQNIERNPPESQGLYALFFTSYQPF